MCAYEQNSPLLTVTRRTACCGFVARAAWLADAKNPTAPNHVLFSLQKQIDEHPCKLDALLPTEPAPLETV